MGGVGVVFDFDAKNRGPCIGMFHDQEIATDAELFIGCLYELRLGHLECTQSLGQHNRELQCVVLERGLWNLGLSENASAKNISDEVISHHPSRT